MHNTPDTPVNVLWTSGWDSTYRVSDLLLIKGRTVQPWYVFDRGRMSAGRELKTLEKMRVALMAKDPSVEDRLLTVKKFHLESIPADPEISASYWKLRERGPLGTQVDWLSRLAKSQGATLEIGIHKDDASHRFLEGLTVADGDGVHRLAPGVDLPAYAHFRFPLFDITKVQMQEAAQKHGFADIQEMTWFCFTPLLDGKPCGFCNPCKCTREEGLGRRVPDPTPTRMLQARVLSKAWRVRNKALRTVQAVARHEVLGTGARVK